MTIRDCCPRCKSTIFKKNGHIHNGKQNHLCKKCGRQFVLNPTQRIVSLEDRELVMRALAERVSLHGVCRVVGVSKRWLLSFDSQCYNSAPEHLNACVPSRPRRVTVGCRRVEADELLSFMQNKANKKWLWLAIDADSRQAIAYYVGDRSKKSASRLWKKVPPVYKEHAMFLTDAYASYRGVFPKRRHLVVSKQSRLTNHIERLNCTLRQRVSRLVRATLSFSKKLTNHIAAIRFFLCQYNLELMARA